MKAADLMEPMASTPSSGSGHPVPLEHVAMRLRALRFDPGKDRTKWAVLLAYCCLSSSNGFQWINFSPIVDESKEYFRMDSLQVNFLVTIYTIVYPALIIVGCIAFQEVGMYGGMVIGALLNALGATLKVVAVLWAPHFGMLCVTQILNAFSEVFFLSLPPLLSSVWFTSEHRTLATALGVMSNSFGTAFGFIVPPLIVTKHDHGQAAFMRLVVWQALFAIAIVGFCFTLPPRPAHVPSITTARPTTMRDLLPSLKFLITHPPFVILAFASGLANDSLWTFASFLAQLLQPFGVSEVQAGWIGFALTISGSVSSTVVGILVDRYRKYKQPLLGFSLSAAACFSCVMLTLLYSSNPNAIFALCFVFVTAMGALLSAAIPLQLEFAVELTYPKPEGITTAFLLCLSGILTPLLTLAGTEVVGNNPDHSSVINFRMGCIVLTCFSATLQLFVRDDRKRVVIEHAVPTSRHASHLGSSSSSSSDCDDDAALTKAGPAIEHRAINHSDSRRPVFV